MKKIYKKDQTFISDNTPGIAGILYSILANILGPIIVVATICFVVNFACKFAGVDFDMFVWIEEFIAGLPAMAEEMINLVTGILAD